MNLFEDAREIIKNNNYKIISHTMMDIGSNNVSLVVKKGRSILTCSCSNSGRFGNDNLCSHKLAYIITTFNKNLYRELDLAIIQIEKYKELKFQTSTLMTEDILNKIKKAK